MIGLDGKVYGHCILFPAVNRYCFAFFLVMDVERKFRCLTSFTASQINAATRQGLTISELAAQLNITGWDPVATSSEDE
jgi:hypothetical protein